MATLVKGDNLLVTIQVENPQVLGVTADLGVVCVNGTRCEKDCNLVNVTNGYHPGTEDSVIKF